MCACACVYGCTAYFPLFIAAKRLRMTKNSGRRF